MDLDRDIGGPPKYLVLKGLEDLLFPFGLCVASLGVLDFDTTSSVIGGTFKSNISLVDPTIQFSRTEKRLVERGVSFTANPVKNPSLHLLSPPFAYPDHQGRWLWLLVLGKFGPRQIGTQTGLDQTQQSRSQSGIFPKIPDRLVSGLGIPVLPETVSDPVWTGTT